MKPTRDLPESELARYVIEYLVHNNCEVYQEVPFRGRSADIVYTKGDSFIGVVETKKNINLDVLEQCTGWFGYANSVYAAAWQPKNSATRFGATVARKFGIGIIYVEPNLFPDHNSNVDCVNTRVSPEFVRKIDPGLRTVLRPEMMTGEYGKAGTNNGGRFTPFKQTTEALLRVVRTCPGITLKDAISQIKTHYASDAAARVNIKKYIEKGIIKGLTLSIDGGKLVLNPL